jgi:hypothetical protein
MPKPATRLENVTQLPQSLALYLAHPLRGQIELLGNALQGAVRIIREPEACAEHESLGVLQQLHGGLQVLPPGRDLQMPVGLLVFGRCYAVDPALAGRGD